MQVGTIDNYYGNLDVEQRDGRYFWGIKDHDDDTRWEEIPASLYTALVDFEFKRRNHTDRRRYFSIINREVLNVIEDKYEPMLSECGCSVSLLNLGDLDSLLERLRTEYVIQEFTCQSCRG